MSIERETVNDSGVPFECVDCVPVYEAGELVFANRLKICKPEEGLLLRLHADLGRGFVLSHVEAVRGGRVGKLWLIRFTLRPAPLGVMALSPRRVWRWRWPVDYSRAHCGYFFVKLRWPLVVRVRWPLFRATLYETQGRDLASGANPPTTESRP